MATINEIIQSAVDRVKLKGSETWIKWSFWTRAKDVELNSGKNVETAVSELDENISNEIDRATDRENEIETALNSEITRAKSAESTLSTSINNEITRAKNAESTLETNKVPITRTINGKALSSDITLSASDVGADASGSANTALTNAKAYTDTKVADLVGTAPETLDTLEELADALKDNADIVDVLNESITSKASTVDLTSHMSNNTAHITADERTAWNAKASKYEWTAKIKGQTWSRIFQVKTSVSVIGNSGILNVSFTRGNVVCNATFMITTSHKNKCFITQLSANSYSPFKIRGVANTHGDAYIELYDYTASISTDTEQAVYCRFIPLRVNTVNVYKEFVDGTTVPTDYTANDPLTVDISGGSMVASKFVGDLVGNATTATKLATARKIGKASFDGSEDISLAVIMGRAQTTSSVNHSGHYTKFATIDVSSGGWTCCAGTLEFLRIEAPTVVGRLQYTFRSQSSITDTYISLYWETISDIKYAETVIATKVSDGVFDLYYKPLVGYDSMTIANTNSYRPELLTLYSQQEYVESLENIVYVSKISAVSTKLTTQAGTAMSAGSETQPVYFSGGKPVACTYTLGKSVPSNAVFTDTTYSTGTATTAGIGKLYTATGTNTDGSMTQNAITTALNGKAASSHTHSIANVTNLQTTLDGKAVKKELISENLNDIKTPGFYNAGGGNSVTNKPSGVNHFGLYVVKRASGDYYTQILIDDKKQYRRHCENGTWGSWAEDKLTDTNTTYGAATTSASGLMTAAMVTKLNGIATGANAYSHPTSSGNKHIPSGGSSGQILRWSADGTAVWGNDNNTTYSNFVKSGSGAKAGLVPAPSTTAGTTKYLREDGTWAVPPDTNTTYTSLKNPYALTIQGNGTTLTNGTYDGSAAKTVNITPSSIGAAASSHTHNYLPLTGGSVSGNIIPSTTNNSLTLGSSTNRWGTLYTNNHDANYIYLRKYMILQEAPATPKIINYATYSQTVYSSSSVDAETSTSTVELGGGQTYSYGTYHNLDTVLKGYRLRLNADSKMSTNVALAIASDEKVKSFTKDIDTDEEKLVKLFDIIKPKSYSYKYVKSDNSNSLNIGFSAQEIEQAMIDLDIDTEKYGILNIQYGHMLSRGNDFEDGKYYTKFYEISYNDLFNLSLLKTHMMEKEHVERLDSLEARLSALENK